MVETYSRGPCPFMQHCALADENCSEEMSATCDVIHKITPPPPKEWNPQELVAVALTREQWESITAWLTYAEDWNHCRMIWWRDCCDNRQEGARQSKLYEATMLRAVNLRKIIEEATHGENKTQ